MINSILILFGVLPASPQWHAYNKQETMNCSPRFDLEKAPFSGLKLTSLQSR